MQCVHSLIAQKWALFSIGVLALASAGTAHAAEFDWAFGIGGQGTEFAHGVGADAMGNVYICGSFEGAVDFNPGAGVDELTSSAEDSGSIFAAKYDASGNLVWARTMGGIFFSSAQDLAVDALGNVYLTGYYNGLADLDPGGGVFNVSGSGGGNLFVVKLDTNGNFVWGYAPPNNVSLLGYSVTVDSVGQAYVTGRFNDAVDFDPGPGTAELETAGGSDVFVVKLDASGNLAWARAFGGPAENEGRGIGVDGSGNVYITGKFEGSVDLDPGAGAAPAVSAGESDIFVVKLDSNGDFVWSRTMSGTGENRGNGLAVSAGGSVHLSGYFASSINFDPFGIGLIRSTTGTSDSFVAKLDTNGNLLWAAVTSGPSFARGTAIALDANGNVFTTGRFVGTVDFNPGAGSFTLNSGGFGTDPFVTKLTGDGEFVWARAAASASSGGGAAIALGPANAVHVFGDFDLSLDADPGAGEFNIASNGGLDLFLLTLKDDAAPIPTSVTGVISDAATDEPIACAAIEVHDLEFGERVVAVTDDNGRYFFAPLPVGSYGVRVLAPGYDTLEPGNIVIDGSGTMIKNYALSPRAQMPVIAGRVTDADTGLPLVWVHARLFIDGAFFDDSYTCGNGFYEIPLSSGKDNGTIDIELEFSLPNFETDTVQQTIDPALGATIDETLQKSVLGLSFLVGGVTGRIGPGSAPLDGARITLRGPVSTSTFTGASGQYAFDTLIDGSYTVTASAEGFEGRTVQRTLVPVIGGEANFELVTTAPPGVPGDVDGDGVVNAVDVQLVINAALGVDIEPGFQPDINGDGVVNAVDVQLVINAALGIPIG